MPSSSPFTFATSPHTLATLGDAERYVRALVEAELVYHFDDGADDCLSRTLSSEQCAIVQNNVNQLYTIPAVLEKYDCPIGLALAFMPSM